jgi:hypothetical protein
MEILIPHIYSELRKHAASTEEGRKKKYREYAAAYVNMIGCGRYSIQDYRKNEDGTVTAICKRKGE